VKRGLSAGYDNLLPPHRLEKGAMRESICLLFSVPYKASQAGLSQDTNIHPFRVYNPRQHQCSPRRTPERKLFWDVDYADISVTFAVFGPLIGSESACLWRHS
jgi:hypothetical protein